MKKLFITLLFLTVALVLSGCFNQKVKQAQTTIRWGVRIDSANYAPQIITTEKKLYEKEGVDVKVIEFADNDMIKTAIATNQIDIGSLSPTKVISLIAQDVPIKILAYGAADRVYLFVRPDGLLKNISDLKNKKLSGEISSTSGLLVSRVLTENGLDPTKDVEFVNLGKTYEPIALSIKKEVDVVMSGALSQANVTKEGAILWPVWKEKGYADIYTPSSAIVGNVDFVNKNTIVVEKLLKAYKKSFDYLANDPEGSAEIVANYIVILF